MIPVIMSTWELVWQVRLSQSSKVLTPHKLIDTVRVTNFMMYYDIIIQYQPRMVKSNDNLYSGVSK